MAIVEMKVPVIGESVTEVTLSQWLKGNGEFVKLDEPICEFESDKATLEFPAEASGKLIHVAAEEDDLEIGALVAARTAVTLALPSIRRPVAPPASAAWAKRTTISVSSSGPSTTGWQDTMSELASCCKMALCCMMPIC